MQFSQTHSRWGFFVNVPHGRPSINPIGECLGGGGTSLWGSPCCWGHPGAACSFLLQLALGVECALSPPVSVTMDGADDIIVRQIMMISVDLLLRREWAEEQAGTPLSLPQFLSLC